MIWDRSGYVTRGVLITITVDKYVVKKSFYSAYYGSSWSITDALLWILRNLRTPILKTPANGCFWLRPEHLQILLRSIIEIEISFTPVRLTDMD